MHYMQLNEILKISYLHTNIHTETSAPLITCVIDDTLLKTMPDISQAPLQFNVMNLVDLLLHFSPAFAQFFNLLGGLKMLRVVPHQCDAQ